VLHIEQKMIDVRMKQTHIYIKQVSEIRVFQSIFAVADTVRENPALAPPIQFGYRLWFPSNEVVNVRY